VAEVEVEGRVGSDEAASLGEWELRLPEQDEALVLAQDALSVDVLRACHAAIMPRLCRAAQGEGRLQGSRLGGTAIAIRTPGASRGSVRLARDFMPLSEAQMAALAEKAAPCSKQALLFRFFERA
jgi:hypothetical protein